MPFWSRQCWCWCLSASWCSNRTTRFSLGLYFLGRGPSACFQLGNLPRAIAPELVCVRARNFRIQRGGLSKFSNPRAAQRATLELKISTSSPETSSLAFNLLPPSSQSRSRPQKIRLNPASVSMQLCRRVSDRRRKSTQITVVVQFENQIVPQFEIRLLRPVIH